MDAVNVDQNSFRQIVTGVASATTVTPNVVLATVTSMAHETTSVKSAEASALVSTTTLETIAIDAPKDISTSPNANVKITFFYFFNFDNNQ